MPSVFMKLMANRNFSRVTDSSIINYLVKPMSFELETAESVINTVRRQRMRELIELETSREREEMSLLRRSSVNTSVCFDQCPKRGHIIMWL